MEEINNFKINLIGKFDTDKKLRDNLYEMWQRIFADPEEFAQYYYKEVYPKNRVFTIGAAKNEKHELYGMIHLNPYVMQIGNKKENLDYIVGVAVEQTMRRQGIMRNMLYQVMQTMRTEGKAFTYLMPAKEAYYTPFDFQFVYVRSSWEQNQIEKKVHHTFQFISCKEEKQFAILSKYYQDFSEKFQIAPVRKNHDWERLAFEKRAENGEILLIYKEYECKGYLTYGMEEETCIVQEIVTKEEIEEVLTDFWDEKQFKKGKAWIDWFHDFSRRSECKEVPTIMFRILHLENMMKLIHAMNPMEILIQVEDPFLKENSGTYQWKFNGEQTMVMKSSEQPEVSVTIAELTQLIFGYHNKKVLKKSEKFQSLIPLHRIYISEIV